MNNIQIFIVSFIAWLILLAISSALINFTFTVGLILTVVTIVWGCMVLSAITDETFCNRLNKLLTKENK